MVAVTAYPLAYALWLSLQRYDLRFPAAREFIGLANYATVLNSSLWWTRWASRCSSPSSRWPWSWPSAWGWP